MSGWRSRLFTAAVLVGGFASGPVPAFAHNVESSGGDGGSPFSFTCTSKGYLASIGGSSGKATDNLSFGCKMNDTGEFYFAGEAGGGGGSGIGDALVCPDDYGIIGIRVFVDGNAVVHHLAVTCQGRHGQGTWDGEMPTRGGVVAYSHYIACPPGEVGTGAYGRAGDLINQVGLKCNPR